MARSSHGSRRATTWAVAQTPRPMPRMVRLGRPANDNFRPSNLLVRAFVITLAAVLALLAAVNWNLI